MPQVIVTVEPGILSVQGSKGIDRLQAIAILHLGIAQLDRKILGPDLPDLKADAGGLIQRAGVKGFDIRRVDK